MSVRVADRVEDWDQRSFGGGYAALQELADAGFSGVVRAGGASLFMTSGTVVGIEHGTIEDFEAGSGTVYESPEPPLPLLAVMQAADADVRAQYYTEETPISEVEGTLSDGAFTGFLELSENVLSGDYFLVFHGGNSMAVGFVGASEKLIAGDEAFETAADEVGIYKVRQVDVEPIEIPDAEDGSAGAAASVEESDEDAAESSAEDDTADAEAAATDTPEDESTQSAATAEAETGSPEPDDSADPEPAAAADAEPADPSPEPDSDSAEPADATARADDVAEVEASVEGGASTSSGTAETSAGESATASTGNRRTGGRSAGDAGGRTDDRDAGSTGTSVAAGSSATGETRSRGGSGRAGEAGDLETRSIPSLDPGMTAVPERESVSSTSRSEPARESAPAASGGEATSRGGAADPQPAEPAADPAGGASGDLAELEEELADKEAEIDRLEGELADAREEREDLEAELEALVDERDDLEAEVERLDSELRRLEEELGAATDAERRMTPAEAIEGTNLFVDYDSKGDATLEKAHGGSESLEEVAENLRLGVHTEFEESAVAVNGQDFDQFLRSTLHYRFAEWLLGTLLFEIRDTGHAEALTDLYDAIPEIRRVEFNGAIDVEYVEDGQEKGGRERFDVIFRHRMGDPLVVANLNDSRDPATGGMMETLVTAGERVGQTADSLSAAFLVTSSFFESEALETVTQATQGGILSRDKRTSFVNLSRKQGYHLCLVAAREGNFHMEVPEL